MAGWAGCTISETLGMKVEPERVDLVLEENVVSFEKNEGCEFDQKASQHLIQARLAQWVGIAGRLQEQIDALVEWEPQV